MNESQLAAQAFDALRRHVLEPLVPRLIDADYGGFLTDFDNEWRAVGPHNKSLEHAARTTIAFALIDQFMPGQGYERFVRQGCRFLQDVMWDSNNGGFFARVDRSGHALWEGLKHPHAVTYTAQAFLIAEPYLAPGEGEKWANRALGWLDDVAWDSAFGGYWGSFRRDNEPYPVGSRLPTSDGRDIFGLTPGFKEINTQGDALEMMVWFAARSPSGCHAERLRFLMELVTDRLIQANGVLPYRYRPDWTPAPDLARVGYQFLMARHLLEGASRVSVPAVIKRVCALVDFCLAFARHPAGGFCFAVTADGRAWPATSESTDLRLWWVQIEAVHTLHLLAVSEDIEAATRNRYRQCRDSLWDFFRTNFFDEESGGIREVPLASTWTQHPIVLRLRRLPVPTPMKSHCWKDPIHEVVTFLALASPHPKLARAAQQSIAAG